MKLLRAFTLIELMIVITIIAILGSIGFFAFDNALNRGRDNKRKQELKSLQGALSSYYQDKGYYPPLCNADAKPPCPVAEGAIKKVSDNTDNWFNEILPYLKDQKTPNDPKVRNTSYVLASDIKPSGFTTPPTHSDAQISGANCNSYTEGVYCYIVNSARNDYILWVRLDNNNDMESIWLTGTHCRFVPPASTYFNFCVEAQK